MLYEELKMHMKWWLQCDVLKAFFIEPTDSRAGGLPILSKGPGTYAK